MSYYQCEAWQVEAEDGEDEHALMQVEDSSLCPVFSIEILANIVSHEPTIVQQLLLPQDQLTQASTSWSAISSRLSQMNVPFSLHATVTQRVIECARSAMNETHNENRNNIPIIVTLCPVRPSEEETVLSDENEGFAESFNLQVFRLRGASKRAIEALEKVKIEGTFTGQCVICLEEILDGLKASRMPCSHVYHQDCIVSWLEKSNLCPLCRFQMPT
ncbi:E3 ubiquitin-protein ligase CHFR-like [Durio zibethinus]|uniref:RING-type E3 ubiquitin transferase n=1 Tax=Durio zibethinus TaxID=66656 RepID=A0A6P5YA86_DURZI|nr:E3 ubiquitin-protein ligase CHFR-like [Durio zibethinus]